MKHLDVSYRIVPVIEKAVCCVLPVQEDKITVLGQGVGIWQVEVAGLPTVIVNVTSKHFDVERVLMIFVSSPPESTEGIDMVTKQYEVRCIDSTDPEVRVVG